MKICSFNSMKERRQKDYLFLQIKIRQQTAHGEPRLIATLVASGFARANVTVFPL